MNSEKVYNISQTCTPLVLSRMSDTSRGSSETQPHLSALFVPKSVAGELTAPSAELPRLIPLLLAHELPCRI